MLRAGSKNYNAVTVITDVDDYTTVIEEMEAEHGGTSLRTRERLAIKVYQRTAAYDRAISNYLNESAGDGWRLQR